MNLFEYTPHPHIEHRKRAGVVKVDEQHTTDNAIQRFNTRLALLITRSVGTMWCAYAFALWDLLSLPASINAGIQGIVQWFAQTFLQLVLLSVIMVGQNVQSVAADKRSEQVYHDVSATLHELGQVHAHLEAQDAVITAIHEHVMKTGTRSRAKAVSGNEGTAPGAPQA